MSPKSLSTLLLLPALFLFSSVAAFSQATLNLSNGSGLPGSTVTLNMSLGGGGNPTGVQWTMNLPTSDLQFDGASTGSAASAAGKSVSCSGSGASITCLVVGFNQDPISNGTVATVRFDIAAGTSATSADISLSALSGTNAAGGSVGVSGSGGTITIQQPVNNDPTATDQSVSVTEDTPTAITLAGTDPDGHSLTFSHGSASHGSLSGSGPNLTYTPALNYNGPDSFTFTVNDGNGGTDNGTVTINVSSENDDPVAQSQNVSTQEGVALGITLQGSDVDGDGLTFTHGSASNGSVTGSGANLTYTPNTNYFGPDSFSFSVSDGNGGTDAGTVSITVTEFNESPEANDSSATTPEDTSVGITLTGTDPDGDSLTYTRGSASHGSLSGSGANLTYTPAQNYHGPDSFGFTVNDGHGNTDNGTVTITVTPENDAPVAQNQNVSTQEDVAVGITLVGTDVDGDGLTFTHGSASNGSITGSGANVTYTPNSGYFGPDSFSFTVNDGNGGSDDGTVSITVTEFNEPPQANDDSIATPEDTAVGITLSGTDPDGDSLTYTHGSASHGSISGSGANLTYTPSQDYHGSDSFTFTANDGKGGTDNGTVSIVVSPVNDDPSAQGQSITAEQDTPRAINLSGSDPDGDSLSYSVTGGPSSGSLSGSAPNLTYTPDNGFIGVDSFTFEVNDGNGGSDTDTITINVLEAGALSLTSVSCGSNSFVGGGSRTCQVNISGAAPGSGLTVGIAVDSSQVSAPASINIASGSTSGSFDLVSSLIQVQETVQVTASLGSGGDRADSLNLIPLRPSSLACSPGQIAPGDTTTCVVGLNSSGFSESVSLAVSSNSGDLQVPSSVPVQPGQSSVSFQAPSDDAAPQQTAVVTVALHGGDVSDAVVIGAASGPVISVSSPQVVEIGSELVFTVTAEDQQGLALTLAAVALPTGATFDIGASKGSTGEQGEFRWTPVADQVGTHLVTFRAENSAGQGVDRIVTIQVVDGSIEITALSNSASFSTDLACSSGSLATLWGVGFTNGSSEVATSFPLPTVLNNISVLMNGELARLLYVGANQINLQCPLLTSARSLQITVERVNGEKESISSSSDTPGRVVRDAAPGIFTLDGSGVGQGMIVIANTSDLAMVTQPGISSRSAIPGNHLTIFANGLGPVDNQVPIGEAAGADPLSRVISKVRVKVGFTYVQVTFAGLAPGFAGLYQVNVRLAQSINTGPAVPVKIEVELADGTVLESNEVTVAIERLD